MARMHARRKGKSGSNKPSNRTSHPDWSSLNPREVEAHVIELAKRGNSTSEIGMILRDQYAVPDVRVATGQKISKTLQKNGLKPEIPEDLRNLINKALQLRDHLETHKKDLKNKRNLQLTESKIRRLVNYYHSRKVLPEGWKSSAKKAKLMFE